ncbi:MAG: hypothetical protein AAF483_03940 [Planctomycetota bacterium]
MSSFLSGSSKNLIFGCFLAASFCYQTSASGQWYPIPSLGPAETEALLRDYEPQLLQPSRQEPIKLNQVRADARYQQDLLSPTGSEYVVLTQMPTAKQLPGGGQGFQPSPVRLASAQQARPSAVVQAAFVEEVESRQPSTNTSSRSRNSTAPATLASANQSLMLPESALPAPVQVTDSNSTTVNLMSSSTGEQSVTISQDNPENINVNGAKGADIRLILAQIAEAKDLDLVVADDVQATVTTNLTDVPPMEALDAILKINQLVWTQQGNIIFVSKPKGASSKVETASTMPGQRLQVFDLHYTSSEEVLTVVNGLLSAAGKAFAHKADISSTRQTRERIVVEDFPDRIDAISKYLASVDNPPRQVLIEANVLQVTLDSNHRHGVNLLGIARLAGAQLDVRTQGFANDQSSPGFMMGLNGTDLDGMVETLQQFSTVETLAAPKVLCVNGQQARIQIGSKFGYFVTTTTQTSTLQNVNFLDIGVVLQVEPTITHDGQVLLTVEPKVSGGRINPDTGLPEEDTTEATTTVLLPDGKGMIIGGLIKETDDHQETWVPLLGKIPLLGKLFSRRNDQMERVEVIIALTTHVVPYGQAVNDREYAQFSRATQKTATEENYAGAIWGEGYTPVETVMPKPVPASRDAKVNVSEDGTRMQFRN